MEQQDMVIEIFRELFADDQKVDTLIPALIDGGKNGKGPKVKRPETREELRIQLRTLEGTNDQLRQRYLELNPSLDPEKYKDKNIQTEAITSQNFHSKG